MIETERIATALAACRVLGRLDDAARLALAKSGAPVELAPGALLFRAGDPGDAAFVVLDGELEVRRQARDGREVRIGALKTGSVAGEMAVLDGAPRSADVLATRRSKLWRIPRPALLGLLQSDPQAAMSLMVELSLRLRHADAELEEARLLDLGARLARLLLSEQSGRGVVALTQTEMARRLGHSREKVNRKLAAWSKSGVVEVTRAGVRILDGHRLGQL